MSLFTYEALDRRGRRRRGEIEASSERAARQALRAQGLVVRRIAAERPRKDEDRALRTKGLSAEETAIFLEQLATLIAAGLTLVEALEAIASSMEGKRGRRVIAAVRQRVLEGSTLAAALQEQRFGEIVCNMVAAGEETGQLEAVAMRLSELLAQRQQLRQELLSATLYPAIILGFGVVVMLFLLAVVVPQVVAVFEHTGGELPWLTRFVIAVSAFIRDQGGWMLLGVLVLVTAWRLAMRAPALRVRRDRAYLAMPWLGSLLARIEMARFARTLGMLLSGNVPVLSALHIANQSWGLLPLRALGEEARVRVREGGSLARALQAHPRIPALARSMIEVGEKGGTLGAMLLRVADHFEREVSRTLKRMLTVAEPLLVLVMAVAVGVLALAILLPIVEMNELIR